MPDALRAVPGAKVVRALERAGLAVASISGSRHVMRHPDGRTVVVPVHAGRDIAKGTVRNILALIGMGAGSSGSCPEPRGADPGLRLMYRPRWGVNRDSLLHGERGSDGRGSGCSIRAEPLRALARARVHRDVML
jgi:predicted RNA binding protein YcfA (HicA-like mRNA interferase family)